MPKSILALLIIILGLAVAGCQGATTAGESLPPSDSTPAVDNAPTATSEAPLAAPDGTPIASTLDDPTATPADALVSAPGCTVVGSITPEPLANSPIPSASAADWGLGPPDAEVTIIEYGDFQ